jgi:outer membrane lipoprotein SlyB
VTQRLLALSVGIALLSGCATTSQSQWTPTVDTYGNSRAQFLSRDTEECRSLAMRSSGSIGEQTTHGAVSGGLVGAAIGGILGGSRSSLGRGAALGAVTGAMAGGASSSAQTEAEFQRAFRNCMRQRGHNVI